MLLACGMPTTAIMPAALALLPRGGTQGPNIFGLYLAQWLSSKAYACLGVMPELRGAQVISKAASLLTNFVRHTTEFKRVQMCLQERYMGMNWLELPFQNMVWNHSGI